MGKISQCISCSIILFIKLSLITPNLSFFEVAMKKVTIALIFFLIFVALLTAQVNGNTIFEGTWFADNPDGVMNLIFRNNNFVWIENDDIFLLVLIGTFTHSEHSMIFYGTHLFDGSKWEYASNDFLMSMEYKFIDNNLIITMDGVSVSLKKIY